MSRRFADKAEIMIRATGARMTRPRIAVLATLLGARSALTHHEIERQMNRALGIDRVTIYRVLEWLTAHGLAHRISGDDRVWRFNAAVDEHTHEHAHFKCNDCGEVICLDKATAARSVPLPSGYRPQEIELTVKGLCADCVPPRAERHRPQGPAQHRH
jgi:Fur family ferric uptake transcriptional regulator